MFRLGNLAISTPVILAPMAGISSYPYRAINRKMGFEFAYLEMISARALSYLSCRTEQILQIMPGDRPLGIQLLGKDSYYILKGLERLREYSFDVLDFNAACPQKKITNNGKGAYLLREPKKLINLLKCIVKNTSKPLVLKMRLGWDDCNDALRIALGAEDAGVTAICVHGRTRMQGYRKGVNYPVIAKIKKAVKIPIIGSGDILSAQLAKKMFHETGVDAVAVARGALGNPWIFKEISDLLENNRVLPRPRIDEIKKQMEEHFNLCCEFYGQKNGVIRFKKFYIWYTRGFANTKSLRTKIAQAKTKQQMQRLIEEFVMFANESVKTP